MRITKVYTKSGDKGETGLASGQRVPKHDVRLVAYGSVDELSASIGWVRQEVKAEAAAFDSEDSIGLIDDLLVYIGQKLFTLGGDLATRFEDRHPKMPVITVEDITYLETACDRYNASLAPLADFILPGGSRSGVALHCARTVARRAERAVSALAAKEQTGGLPLQYLNRLSDVLFVLARWVNKQQGVPEVIWKRDNEKPPLPGDS